MHACRKDTGSPVVKEWLRRHPEFHLSQIPAYSPNVNLIERMWKFLRAKALCRWHKTFEDMQAAVSEVLDHLEDYRGELRTLMTEKFHIIDKKDIPVQYRRGRLTIPARFKAQSQPIHASTPCKERISRRCSVPARRRHSHSAMRNRRFHLFLPPIGSPPATVYHVAN